MAESPESELVFTAGCPDCARREVRNLPGVLPDVGNDFDWRVRDYDGFRLFMMEELAARFPERRRWTPADMEVVLVEALAAVLDQLSDMVDRVTAEAWLQTARRPESVRRLLQFIGYDPVRKAYAQEQIGKNPDEDLEAARAELERVWLTSPWMMDEARRAGPREIHTQRRMVSVEDYGSLLEEHPLVIRANAFVEWGGSWPVVRVAVVCWGDRPLDKAEKQARDDGEPLLTDDLKEQVKDFHFERGLRAPVWNDQTTFRSLLGSYVDRYRMIGQEALLQDAVPVGISLSLTVQVDPDYFQSEVRRAAEQVLGKGTGGFFEPGRLRFGEDIRASDIIQALMALDGVQTVCLNRFKRVGGRYADQSGSGRIILQGIELAACDNNPKAPERGYYDLKLLGGRRG
ncbi:hypothetical protein ACN28E_31030 [Archangium lansingense]|uniref:hypothetical protein n=1 Tax=Archangium lansingense TaxID=2995310 RepID=UPI003B7D6807